MSTTTVNVPPTQTPVSPKAWSAAALTLAASIVAALCATVLANPDLISALPTWAVGLIIGVLPAIAAWVGVYVKRDPLRDAGAEQLRLVNALNDEAPHTTTLAGHDEATDAAAAEPTPAAEPVLPPSLVTALDRLAASGQLPKYASTELEAAGYGTEQAKA